MKLPNARRARVEQSKIVEYLLNHEHPDGRSKAAFFERFGFRAADWQQLADALRNQAIESPVADRAQSPYGTRYVIDGPIDTPTNEQPYSKNRLDCGPHDDACNPSSGDGVSAFTIVDPECHD
jgi:hypothetical protein